MAIRRISDLPELSRTEELSDCIFEVSYKDDNNTYNSRYASPSRLGDYIVNYFSTTTLGDTTINGDLCVTGGDVNIDNPNNNTSIHSNNISLCSEGDTNIKAKGNGTFIADGTLELYGKNGTTLGTTDSRTDVNGNPVVINSILSIWNNTDRKTIEADSGAVSYFTNANNELYSKTVALASYELAANKNKVVTCELLANSVGAATTLLATLNDGNGVSLT